MVSKDQVELFHARNAQMAEQPAVCPDCGGTGESIDVIETPGGGYKKKFQGTCETCEAVGYGLFCPICSNFATTDDLDFHHWDYDEQVGVFLCRECHDKIHTDGEAYPSKNDNWDVKAAENAISELYQQHPQKPPGISELGSRSWLEAARDVLNIPNEIQISTPDGFHE